MSVSTVSSAAESCGRPLRRRVSHSCSGFSRKAMNSAHSSGPTNGWTIFEQRDPEQQGRDQCERSCVKHANSP